MNRWLTRLMIITALATSIAGCATHPTLQQIEAFAAPMPAGKARVVAIHPNGFSEMLVPFTRTLHFWVDGLDRGELDRGNYIGVDVDPGPHMTMIRVTQTINDNFLQFPVSLKAGETAYIMCKSLGGPTYCKRIGEKEAQSDIAEINKSVREGK